MKLDPYLILYTKINSKWMEDLNVRPETIKLLDKDIRGKLLDTDIGNDILDFTPKANTTKARKTSGVT